MVNEFYLDEIVKNISCQLKDFQNATVERVNQIYTEEHKNRVLVSDEVGLGKTLVAKGVIAKYANYRYEQGDDLFKVVYICSNSTIVDQNLKKLKLVNEIQPEKGDNSRLSMQHFNIYKQSNDGIVFKKDKSSTIGMNIELIPMTPETSFNVTNSLGTVNERALMFAILSEFKELKDYSHELECIFKRVDDWADDKIRWMAHVFDVGEKYIEDMAEAVFNYPKNSKKSGEDIRKLINFCKKIKEKNLHEQIQDKNGSYSKTVKKFIVRFREIFADISVDMLDADLVILDEFQRFKPILNSAEGSEMYKLAKKFFDPENDVKILMLSATPYKMYSSLDEISKNEMDTHYSEFLDLMKFLKEPENDMDDFKEVWDDYSLQLKELCKNENTILCAKSKAESELFNNVCRTERLSEGHLTNFIDDSYAKNSLSVLEGDILSYVYAQNISDTINVPFDYIKSSPYVMSYMEGYKFKKDAEEYFKKHPDELDNLKNDVLWIKKSDIENFDKISPNNARLNDLMNHVFKNNASNLLWVPPSMPYYELGGVFKDCDSYSKTLVFSAWDMVPKMISTMVSYEFERQTIGQLENHVNYSYKKKNLSNQTNPSPKMSFAKEYDYYNKMLLFSLVYPSQFLANVYNPLDYFNKKITIDMIEMDIKEKIESMLDDNSVEDDDEKVDDRWYYLAPLILDYRSSKSDYNINLWLQQFDKFANSYNESFLECYEQLKEEYVEFILKGGKLGRKPNDLMNVLCDMAIASPSICSYRSYLNELPSDCSINSYLGIMSQIGMAFMKLMNQPESIAVIDLNFKPNLEYHWKNVLKYSKDGNLQAVFDEYVHLLSNDVFEEGEKRILSIHEEFLSAFEFDTTKSNQIDTFDSFKSEIETGKSDKIRLRTNYAASFAKNSGNDKNSNRPKTIMDAFNSPFRPFVLTSTSTGQEGLDLHKYCRKIVHWNLPSNPIDLEQREGRINRFECLFIRQNVARRYGDELKDPEVNVEGNIWKVLFDIAYEKENAKICSDLIPHWGLTESEDMVKIERIVPMYPCSNDKTKYEKLIKILSTYRLTLGQPGQEKLLKSTINNCKLNVIDIDDLYINLSPYFKNDIGDSEYGCED